MSADASSGEEQLPDFDLRAAVAVEGLRKSFRKVVALDGIDLRVAQGSTHLLLGPNGSGKTTLIRLLAGVLRPTKGAVLVLGEDPYRYPDRIAKEVGIAYENHSLSAWADARTYLRFAAHAKGLGEEAVDVEGDRFGLRGYWKREMGDYSAGMRKRVMLAQAWLGDPPLLILDEPYSNLDPEGRRLLASLLTERSSHGLTTLIATHLAESGTTPTHLDFLLNGRMEAKGPIRELGERYRALTVTVSVPDPEAAGRLLFDQGIPGVSRVEEGLTVRGGGETIEAAKDALRAGGIQVREASVSYDIWAIYRAVLYGESEGATPSESPEI